MILIGYSGHSYVVNGIFHSMGIKVFGYCDNDEKTINPFSLKYLGKELSSSGLEALSHTGFFISTGNNLLRHKIFQSLAQRNLFPVNAVHTSAIIDFSAKISGHGVMISANAIINALAHIGKGAICNTGCIIEHECQVGAFAHVGPGAVLCGNVHVGENSFLGAQSVIKEGIKIGKNVIVGAGSVVVKDVPDNVIVVGNPARTLTKH